VKSLAQEMEMPVLLVTQDLIARSVSGDAPVGDAARAVSAWTSKVPG
jgi:hypothetical protein